MEERERQCSGLMVDEARFGAEFCNIVDTLFCACLEDMESRESRMPRELFRLVEIEGRPLAEAAGALGLRVGEARDMLAKTRRDIAVLMALGLCRPDSGQRGEDRRNSGCRCRGNSTLAGPGG